MTKIAKLLLTATMLTIPTVATAQIPVTDATQIGQNIQDLAHEVTKIKHMVTQIEQLKSQITELQKHTEALTGDYDLSSLANSDLFKELRRLESDLNDILSIADGGGTGPIAELGREALEEYGILEGVALFPNESDDNPNPLLVAHDKSRNVIAAGAGTARATIAGADRRVDVYEAFIEEIDSTPNAKASSDLHARILAENGLLMNELLRVTAMNLELQQTLLARELASDQADTIFYSTNGE